MNELTAWTNPEFGEIRSTTIGGNPWFVGVDIASALGYSNTIKAVKTHVDAEDMQEIQTSQNGNFEVPNRGITVINESGMYSLILRSKLESAKRFKHWVTSDVLPSIQRTGSYSVNQQQYLALPQDYPSALRALADSYERVTALQTTVASQQQEISELTPFKTYVETILSSERCLTTTQIAADYGMTANKLNRILHTAGIQRYVNGQWVLYQKYLGKGYTKSETIAITRSNGKQDTVMHTKWTQKGRLLIHKVLTSLGYTATMDKVG